MMQRKWTGMLLIGMIALSVAACGNQGNNEQAPASAPPEPVASAEATSQPSSQPSSYEALYRTSVFFGDSITEGLSYHDVLNEENVLAGAGKTAEFAQEDLDDLVGRKPERVFIQLGSDDILWPTDDPKEYSLTHYAQLIDSIQSKLPKAKITLLSVTPVTADAEKTAPAEDVTVLSAWLGILAFTFQIYFDFSGYSDMARGLAKMFGFEFKANFNYPYISRSVTEFWRRWHISLSSWFREYVYIPLGGNRLGLRKQLRNLLIVWLLTGLCTGPVGTLSSGAYISDCS